MNESAQGHTSRLEGTQSQGGEKSPPDSVSEGKTEMHYVSVRLEESGKREYPLELPVVWTAMIRVKHGWR